MIEERFRKAEKIIPDLLVKVAESFVIFPGEIAILHLNRFMPGSEQIESNIKSAFFRLGDKEIKLSPTLRLE